MAFKDLSQTEIDAVFDAERVVRLGFDAGGEHYLVPLGFVRHRDAIYAMTTRGRKTRMAAANSSVSFQIDTSARTGPFQWHSVGGTGTFELATDPAEIEAVSSLLVARFPDMPQWMQAEYAEKQTRGEVVLARVRLTSVIGRKSEPV